jgi:hypothetical protein
MYEFTKDISVVEFVNLYEKSRNRDVRLYMEINNDNDSVKLDKIIM